MEGSQTANELETSPALHREPVLDTATDERSSHAALRAIATVEILKGLGVLVIGFGLLRLLHRNVQLEAVNLLIHLHINPDSRLPQAFLNAAANVTSGRLWLYAAACATYAAVRFTEGYGLWHSRVWAEWFALLSGAMYLPWELIKVVEHPNLVHWSLLLINLAVIAYMAYIRIRACVPPRSKLGQEPERGA
jgi:uncharacterized membrane protein (DUF2068 family)